eukprot:g14180.t1
MDPQLAEYRRRMAARARGAGDAGAAPTSSTTPGPGPRPLLDLALPTYQWALLLVLAVFVARNSSIGLLLLLCGLLLVAAAIYTQLLDATARETVTTFLFRTQFAVRELSAGEAGSSLTPGGELQVERRRGARGPGARGRPPGELQMVEDVVVPPGDAFATHFALEPMAEAEAEGGGGVSRRRKNLVRLPVWQWLLLLLATCFLFGAGVLGWLTAFGLLYTFMRKNGARKLQRWWASASSTSSR